jgi:hypothetical protein
VVLFLITIIRFYLGSILYFDAVHISEKTSERYRRKSYGLDFIVGLMHFTAFFAWATTIADVSHREATTYVSHFETVGAAILLYDLAWIVANFRYDTREAIMPWAVVNTLTVLICAVVVFTPYAMDAVFKEQAIICLVGAVGIIDIAGTLRQRNYIADWIASIFPSTEKHLFS